MPLTLSFIFNNGTTSLNITTIGSLLVTICHCVIIMPSLSLRLRIIVTLLLAVIADAVTTCHDNYVRYTMADAATDFRHTSLRHDCRRMPPLRFLPSLIFRYYVGRYIEYRRHALPPPHYATPPLRHATRHFALMLLPLSHVTLWPSPLFSHYTVARLVCWLLCRHTPPRRCRSPPPSSQLVEYTAVTASAIDAARHYAAGPR